MKLYSPGDATDPNTTRASDIRLPTGTTNRNRLLQTHAHTHTHVYLATHVYVQTRLDM